jgi:hypothetical protein
MCTVEKVELFQAISAISSPLLLMQCSKIQPKKSNAKNGKDKRVFF